MESADKERGNDTHIRVAQNDDTALIRGWTWSVNASVLM